MSLGAAVPSAAPRPFEALPLGAVLGSTMESRLLLPGAPLSELDVTMIAATPAPTRSPRAMSTPFRRQLGAAAPGGADAESSDGVDGESSRELVATSSGGASSDAWPSGCSSKPASYPFQHPVWKTPFSSRVPSMTTSTASSSATGFPHSSHSGTALSVGRAPFRLVGAARVEAPGAQVQSSTATNSASASAHTRSRSSSRPRTKTLRPSTRSTHPSTVSGTPIGVRLR